MSNYSQDILTTVLQFLPNKYKSKVLTSSQILPKLDLLVDNIDLNDRVFCDSFSEEDFNILIKNTNLNKQNFFNCVIRRGLIKYIKILLQDPRVNPADHYNLAIRLSSLSGRTEVVKLLLQDTRVNPTDQNNKAIILASENGHTEVVKLLLHDRKSSRSI